MTQEELVKVLEGFLQEGVERVVLSMPAEKSASRRISVRRVPKGYQSERIIGKQAFHENLSLAEVRQLVQKKLGSEYRQLNAWDAATELMVSLSRDGQIQCHRKKRAAVAEPAGTGAAVAGEYNRVKKHLLPEGEVIPPLVDMGIFTAEGRLVPSMADKYRQINRFVEIVSDVLGDDWGERPFRAIDFGCGKSYLTFIVYYYLAVKRGMSVRMTGLDLKREVIGHCNEAARKYGYDGLSFEVGDINGYATAEPVDMVMTLHACDTATDYALAHAVSWGARNILSVPCCQHELNKQMHSEELSILCRYGIVQERTAALMTDALRANLLTVCGYRTQILEFVDLSHTPKNLLIRAVKSQLPLEVRERAWKEAQALMSAFGLRPTLAGLLEEAVQKSLSEA